MPHYVVTGVGIATGRARTRRYEATDEADARAQAQADGTRIDTLTREPDPPATERQLAYARDLGIHVPAGATLDEASDLLSAKLDGPIRPELAAYLTSRGLRPARSQRYGSGALTDAEHVEWYLFNVARAVLRVRWKHPNDSAVSLDLADLAERFMADPKALASYNRAVPTSRSTDWWPGTIDISSTGTDLESTGTHAYQAAAQLIRAAAGATRDRRGPVYSVPPEPRQERRAKGPLVPCPKCGAMLAKDARACPACGARRDRIDRFMRALPGTLLLLGLTWIVIQCTGAQ